MLVVDRLATALFETPTPDLAALLQTGALRYIDAAEIGTLDVALTPSRCRGIENAGLNDTGCLHRLF